LSQFFAGSDIYEKSKFDGLGLDKQICAIGRVVAICRYMNKKEVQRRLENTITGIEGLLKTIANDPDIIKITSKWTTKPDFEADHKKFFKKLYDNGFDNGVKRLNDYARRVQKTDEYKALKDDDKRKWAVDNVVRALIVPGGGKYCPNGRLGIPVPDDGDDDN